MNRASCEGKEVASIPFPLPVRKTHLISLTDSVSVNLWDLLPKIDGMAVTESVTTDMKSADGLVIKALENLRMRLLDLTARNRLINFKHTKSASLRVIDELPDQLVETLLAECEMRFRAVPEPAPEQLVEAGHLKIDEVTGEVRNVKKDPAAEEWARWLGIETSYEVPLPSAKEPHAKHSDHAIQTLLFPYEMETRLRNLRQKSESAIEETGANILYIAFGFLEWYERNDSDIARIAPLFLVPARLHKGRLNPAAKIYEYTLSYSGEDIIPNLSLREKLRVDFGFALPDLDETTRPEAYFKSVLEVVRDNQPRWRVRRYISLTLLNFGKLLMYLDLDPDRWPERSPITEHPVVSRFLVGYDGGQQQDEVNENLGFGEEHPIDELPDIHEKYPLIEDADSSQHSALVDAIKGENLVIEGPPGTGKSQTITNLIAATMAQGNRVLFVAEKLAALEVVKRHLDAAGLGDFCLELHSHKSQKRKVLDEIQARLERQGKYRKPEHIEADINRYEDLKLKLKAHVERINRRWKDTGKTLHEIFMAATRYRETMRINPEVLHPKGYDGTSFDATTQRSTRDEVLAFREVYDGVARQIEENGMLRHHPWHGIRNTELQMFDLDRVQAALADWQATLSELAGIRPDFAVQLHCRLSDVPSTLSGFQRLLEDLERFPALEGDELLDMVADFRGDRREKARTYFKLLDDIQALYADLSTKVLPSALEDFSSIDAYRSGSGQLAALVGHSVTLGQLNEAIHNLKCLQRRLAEFQQIVLDIQAAIGQAASKYLNLSARGLCELHLLIETVAVLKPTLWRLRHNRFDNDELDPVLPILRGELETLQVLREELAGIYHLESLTNTAVLEKLRVTLNAGGAFRWLKPSWRAARKTLVSHAANAQVKLADMIRLLEKAALFSEKRQQFEKTPLYKDLLGEHFKGLDTALSSLAALRSWYRQVRNIYGIGFGQKVWLGSAILDLPSDVAKAIRSLAEQGVDRRLGDLLDEFEILKTTFVPSAEIQADDVPLVGDGGVIGPLLDALQAGLGQCKLIVSDDGLSIAELSRRIKALEMLRQATILWTDANLDNKLFGGRLGLRFGPDVDNSNRLAAARHTLHIADWLEQDVRSDLIRQHVADAPTASTFEALHSIAGQIKTALDREAEKGLAFAELVDLDRESWTDGDAIDGLIERNDKALTHGTSLLNWLDLARARDRLSKLGFQCLIDVVEKDLIPVERVEEAYYAGVYDALAREILREDPDLARFSGHNQEALQKRFVEYDEQLKRLQREKIAWQADLAKLPPGIRGGPVSHYTERALLEHECAKKKRHLPIRQLLQRAAGALAALKPCFMMGPMSVAQYLPPGLIEFDMVIMDEASQIKPEDALGTIARGAQLVVVGDPKQLPPTSFFDRVLDDEDEDPTAIEESESILDAALPMFPARRLRWHYRSRHESLIAFSNHWFYGGNLVLFPSPHKASDDYGLRYSPVRRGCFVNRRNLEEAKAISEAVREHFRHRSEETLGVVAMSAEQRDQIEGAMEMLAKDDPPFQSWLEKDRERSESLFVKNLENVQGDERDVIFVSMTYGPREPGGKVLQRFGPINSDVGWRRLNVLFTRSRKRMHVFSSMEPEDIIVGHTSRRGIKALRDFLTYCKTGIPYEIVDATGRAPDSDFEVAVAQALRDSGFDCIPQVGVAGFFIDIAVVDPGNPGRYLMGIECDGATYHSAKSVRDRDRLRQGILERLGWHIRRIWSTDWYRNPQAELQPIIRELNKLKNEARKVYEPELEPEAEKISEIIEEVEKQEVVVDHYLSEEIELRERLVAFEREIIRKQLPNTPKANRLLRPAMLEALLEYTPTSKWEFLERIPPYLRQATAAPEGEYLEQVLEIINASMEVA